MADYRIQTGFVRNLKTRRLMRQVKDGLWHLLSLWDYCTENQYDGDLSGMDDDDIAVVCQYDGDGKRFVEKMVELGWIDGEPGARKVHAWAEYQSWVIKTGDRKASSVNANVCKALIHNKTNDRPGGPQRCTAPVDRSGDTPFPFPSLPSPSSPNPSDPPQATPSEKQDPSGRAARLEEAFNIWKDLLGHPRAKFPHDPKDLSLRRLDSFFRCYTMDDWATVCRGAIEDMKRWPDRKHNDGIDLLLRDASHINKFLELGRGDTERVATPSRADRYTEAEQTWTRINAVINGLTQTGDGDAYNAGLDILDDDPATKAALAQFGEDTQAAVYYLNSIGVAERARLKRAFVDSHVAAAAGVSNA